MTPQTNYLTCSSQISLNLRNILLHPLFIETPSLSICISNFVDVSFPFKEPCSLTNEGILNYLNKNSAFSFLNTLCPSSHLGLKKEESLGSTFKEDLKNLGMVQRALILIDYKRCLMISISLLSKMIILNGKAQDKISQYLYDNISDHLSITHEKALAIYRSCLNDNLNQIAFRLLSSKINLENKIYLSQLRKFFSLDQKDTPKRKNKIDCVQSNSVKEIGLSEEDKDFEFHEEASTASESSRDTEVKSEIDVWSIPALNLKDSVQKKTEDKSDTLYFNENEIETSCFFQNALSSYDGFFVGNLEITFDPSDRFLSLPMRPLPKKKEFPKTTNKDQNMRKSFQYDNNVNKFYSPPSFSNHSKNEKKRWQKFPLTPQHSENKFKPLPPSHYTSKNNSPQIPAQSLTSTKKKINFENDSEGIPMSAFIDPRLNELNFQKEKRKKENDVPEAKFNKFETHRQSSFQNFVKKAK